MKKNHNEQIQNSEILYKTLRNLAKKLLFSAGGIVFLSLLSQPKKDFYSLVLT